MKMQLDEPHETQSAVAWHPDEPADVEDAA